jgi:hypothetical protein
MTRRPFAALACLVLSTIVVAPVAAQQSGASGDNVVLTVRIGSIADGERTVDKTYRLVLSPGSEGSRLLSGARVPLATETKEIDDTGDANAEVIAAFTYQNIGFSITAEAQVVEPSRILLRALLEDSRIGQADTAGPPPVETRQLSVNVVLTNGEPLEITRVERAAGDSGFVEVQADLVD